MTIFRTPSNSFGTVVTTTISSHPRPEPAVHQNSTNHGSSTNGNNCPEKEPLLGSDQYDQPEQEQKQKNNRLHWEPLGSGCDKPKGPPKFEAYMMTGEHILNISRMPQTTLILKQQKKVIKFYL